MDSTLLCRDLSVHEALIELENSICNKDAESHLEKALDSFIMKNLPPEFLETSDTIRILNIMRRLKMDIHHVNGSSDLGGISQGVFKGVSDRVVNLLRNSREGSEVRDYLDSPGLRSGGQLERYAMRKSCGPEEIIGTLNATEISPV